MLYVSLKFCVGSIYSYPWPHTVTCGQRAAGWTCLEMVSALGTETRTRPPTGAAEGRPHKEKTQCEHLGKHDSVIPGPGKLSIPQTRTGSVQTSPEDIQHRLHQSQQGHGTAADVSQVEHEANAAANLGPQGPADHD